jgi:hypothetical protein
MAWLTVLLAGTGLPGLVGLPSAAAAPWAVRSTAARSAATAVPAAPFVVSVSGVGLGVLVDWAPNPPGEDLTSYSVTASPAARSKTKACPVPRAVTVSATPADTAAVVGGLCASVVYKVRAVAVNSAGRSAPSAASAPVVPLTAQPPDPPLIVSVTARDTTLLVNWSRPAYDGGRLVTGYLLRAAHGAQVVTVHAAAKATSATVTGLTDGVAYTLSLTASSAAGNSAPDKGTGTPSAEYPPSPPMGLSTVPDNTGGVTVSWQPPADDGGGTVTGYTISYQQQRRSTAGVWTPVPGAPVETAAEPASATSATVTAFPASPAFYLFWITAANSAGTGRRAIAPAPVSPTTASKPSTVILAPASVSALASVTATSLVWHDPAPSQVTAVRVGDVLTCDAGGLLPDGMLRKVTAIAGKGTSLTLTTTQATLTDAVTNMSLASTVQTGAAKVAGAPVRAVFVPRSAGVSVRGAAPNGTVNAQTTFSVSLTSGPISVGFQFGLNAQVGLDINVDHGFLDVPDGVSVSASALATFSAQGQVKVQGAYKVPLETEVGELDLEPITIDAIVPIVIVPKLPVFLKISGQASTGFQGQITVGGALSWSSSDAGHLDLTNLSKVSVGGSPLPGLNAFSVKEFIGLSMTATLLADDAIGPDVEADLGMQETVNPVPTQGQPYFEIGPVLQLKAGLDLDLYIIHPQLNVTLAQFDFAPFLIQSPPAPTYAITPANPVLTPGQSVTFKAVRSDGVRKPLIWSLTGNTSGDKITSSGSLTVAAPLGRTLSVNVTDPTGAVGTTTVMIGTPSDPPGALSVSQTANRPFALQLNWTAPAATGGFPISGYRIVTQPQSVVPSQSNTTHATLVGVAPGLSTINVYAVNSAGLVSPPATADAYIYPDGSYSPPGMVWTTSDARLTVGTPSSQSLQFYGMACGAAGSCAALGFYVDSKGIVHGTIDTLANRTWTSTVAPLPARAASDRQSTLYAVTCPAAGSCVVVGDYIDRNGNYQPLIETLANGTWRAVKAPLPAKAVASRIFATALQAVTCRTRGSCTAVGGYTDNNANLQGLIETLSNGTWKATKAPLPTRASSLPSAGLRAVACLAAGSCIATGSYKDSKGNRRGLIDTFTRGTWAATRAPLPADAAGNPVAGLGAIACPAAGVCTAVGQYTDTKGNGQGVIETLSNRTWTATEAPVPAAAKDSPVVNFTAIVCPAVGSCTALGTYIGLDAQIRGVFETLANRTWTGTVAPLPANAISFATAVFAQNGGTGALACMAAGSCTAVGSYVDVHGNSQGLIETLSNGTWTANEAPLPPNAARKPGASLGAVACPPASSCTAIGNYTDASKKDEGLIETQQ